MPAVARRPPSLFLDAEGTAQREAVRRWHLAWHRPTLGAAVGAWLTAKLETPVRLRFDSYALDMVSRATVVAKLTQAGVALAAVGMLDEAAAA